jgi:hypothetical protein
MYTVSVLSQAGSCSSFVTVRADGARCKIGTKIFQLGEIVQQHQQQQLNNKQDLLANAATFHHDSRQWLPKHYSAAFDTAGPVLASSPSILKNAMKKNNSMIKKQACAYIKLNVCTGLFFNHTIVLLHSNFCNGWT